MENFVFKQRSKRKSMVLLIFYCLFILAIGIFVGTGKYGILDFINSFRKPMIPSLIFGILLLSPLLFLVKLTIRKIEIHIDNNQIIIEDRKTIKIPIHKIDSIKINIPRVNTVNLYSQDKLLYCFDNGSKDGGELIMKLAKSIINKGDFEETIKQKKIIGGVMDTFEYSKN